MLSCREVSRLAAERMDRPLTVSETMQFYFHLAMCRACSRYARQLRWLSRATGRWREHQHEALEQECLPAEARQRIRRRLQDEGGADSDSDRRY